MAAISLSQSEAKLEYATVALKIANENLAKKRSQAAYLQLQESQALLEEAKREVRMASLLHASLSTQENEAKDAARLGAYLAKANVEQLQLKAALEEAKQKEKRAKFELKQLKDKAAQQEAKEILRKVRVEASELKKQAEQKEAQRKKALKEQARAVVLLKKAIEKPAAKLVAKPAAKKFELVPVIEEKIKAQTIDAATLAAQAAADLAYQQGMQKVALLKDLVAKKAGLRAQQTSMDLKAARLELKQAKATQQEQSRLLAQAQKALTKATDTLNKATQKSNASRLAYEQALKSSKQGKIDELFAKLLLGKKSLEAAQQAQNTALAQIALAKEQEKEAKAQVELLQAELEQAKAAAQQAQSEASSLKDAAKAAKKQADELSLTAAQKESELNTKKELASKALAQKASAEAKSAKLEELLNKAKSNKELASKSEQLGSELTAALSELKTAALELEEGSKAAKLGGEALTLAQNMQNLQKAEKELLASQLDTKPAKTAQNESKQSIDSSKEVVNAATSELGAVLAAQNSMKEKIAALQSEAAKLNQSELNASTLALQTALNATASKFEELQKAMGAGESNKKAKAELEAIRNKVTEFDREVLAYDLYYGYRNSSGKATFDYRKIEDASLSNINDRRTHTKKLLEYTQDRQVLIEELRAAGKDLGISEASLNGSTRYLKPVQDFAEQNVSKLDKAEATLKYIEDNKDYIQDGIKSFAKYRDYGCGSASYYCGHSYNYNAVVKAEDKHLFEYNLQSPNTVLKAKDTDKAKVDKWIEGNMQFFTSMKQGIDKRLEVVQTIDTTGSTQSLVYAKQAAAMMEKAVNSLNKYKEAYNNETLTEQEKYAQLSKFGSEIISEAWIGNSNSSALWYGTQYFYDGVIYRELANKTVAPVAFKGSGSTLANDIYYIESYIGGHAYSIDTSLNKVKAAMQGEQAAINKAKVETSTSLDALQAKNTAVEGELKKIDSQQEQAAKVAASASAAAKDELVAKISAIGSEVESQKAAAQSDAQSKEAELAAAQSSLDAAQKELNDSQLAAQKAAQEAQSKEQAAQSFKIDDKSAEAANKLEAAQSEEQAAQQAQAAAQNDLAKASQSIEAAKAQQALQEAELSSEQAAQAKELEKLAQIKAASEAAASEQALAQAQKAEQEQKAQNSASQSQEAEQKLARLKAELEAKKAELADLSQALSKADAELLEAKKDAQELAEASALKAQLAQDAKALEQAQADAADLAAELEGGKINTDETAKTEGGKINTDETASSDSAEGSDVSAEAKDSSDSAEAKDSSDSTEAKGSAEASDDAAKNSSAEGSAA